ncbi:hypothetical protein Acr_23g0000890 [Actinidia rufa]|uniref:Ubiquitin thioesterase OTU n=1 Tax=Actinidia rufa TaxID=165716 RepID=A0A7J0GM01_9ERIC|nr:hypothetical protein Acr_23g0000890 [Actinidia rufa]
MLGILCARHKPWILASLSLAHTSPAALTNRVAGNQIRLVGSGQPLRLHSRACRLSAGGGVAASIWHAILPSGGVGRRPAFHNMRGEGSWNVAWDARPARWLHRLDSAWLLFGVCACRAASLEWADVVDELLRRRKETKWFIEEDFDTYVNRIRQPYAWGGAPELLMASHVLNFFILLWPQDTDNRLHIMIDRSSGGLVKIANYVEEYEKDKESPITILFHGYGHYDILEAVSDQSCH